MQFQDTPCAYCGAVRSPDGSLTCRPRCFGARSLPIPERLWGRVCRSADGCWEWTGRRNAFGYGILGVNGIECRTHRLAWELTHGPIPDGLRVLHRCDNPPCVRPDHLFLGTDADNIRDMCAKGRSVQQTHPERMPRGDRHGARLHPERMPRGDNHYSRLQPERLARGERIIGSKLTTETVLEMRANFRPGVDTYTAIAQRYGITRRAATLVLTRQTWTHI